MASRKNDDERKARARYIDQPGQWVDVTPASVKKKQDKAWEKLYADLKKDPAWARRFAKAEKGQKKGKQGQK